jgi:hypothetical protein
MPEQRTESADSVPSRTRREPLRIYHDPMPRAHHGRRSKYPFAQMRVGDCFYVDRRELRHSNGLSAAARQWAKRNSKDWRFVCRVGGDRVGIWRVA